MKIFICQLYIEPEASFPFSHHFQILISEMVASRVKATTNFDSRFPWAEKVIINISAKSQLSTMELRGPTIFKKNKSIEYSVFLPFTILQKEIQASGSFESPIRSVITGTISALEELGLDCEHLKLDYLAIVQAILERPSIIRKED